MKKVIILGMLMMVLGICGCNIFENDDDDSSTSSSTNELVGTWVRSSSSEYEKVTYNSNMSFTNSLKTSITDDNNYTLETQTGTYTVNTSSSPKIGQGSYTYTRTKYTNGVAGTPSSGSSAYFCYYKVENSKLYLSASSSSWTGAYVYTKQ